VNRFALKLNSQDLYKKLKSIARSYVYFFENKKKSRFQQYLAHFSADKPLESNPFGLFEACWSTKIPNVDYTGSFEGFDDERIKWLLHELGSIEGQHLLELGPLEAGHTFMLEKAGAELLSIEGNYGAFLRCLTVKNFLGLKAKFLLGDFSKVELDNMHFNLIVACGVLYHMAEPIRLLEKLSKNTDSIFIWTHYFEEDLEKWSPITKRDLARGKWDIKNTKTQEFNGISIRTVRQKYGKALGWKGFCGGTEAYSYWIYKQDLMALLKKLGFVNLRVNFDKVDHPNGPCFAIIGRKLDLSYYLHPDINPDLYAAFGALPHDEQRRAAIEHFEVYGRKEGRKPVKPN
tara:strand:+ start:355 stop:1392 length:1038 start_codon:yes stop_codon:yes gene_type:complete